MQRLVIAAVCFVCTCSLFAYEGRRADSVLLNGRWEYALGEGDERAELPAGQAKLEWQEITLPKYTFVVSEERQEEKISAKIKFVWAKRKFDLSKARADKLAVLRWNRIAFGATVFINGRRVGWNEPTGPYQVILPSGILKAGENEIVLKVCGPAGVRKSKSGYFMFPAGFSGPSAKGMPAVTDDVWIDFADRAYMKWVLAMPNLAGERVRIRVTPVGPRPLDDMKITAAVGPWPKGKIAGRGETPAKLTPTKDPLGGEHFYIDVPMPGFKPWTYEDRNLYTAEVRVNKDGKVLDALTFRFGMREIEVVDGNYKLNGKNLWLRGSNLVIEAVYRYRSQGDEF